MQYVIVRVTNLVAVTAIGTAKFSKCVLDKWPTITPKAIPLQTNSLRQYDCHEFDGLGDGHRALLRSAGAQRQRQPLTMRQLH